MTNTVTASFIHVAQIHTKRMSGMFFDFFKRGKLVS